MRTVRPTRKLDLDPATVRRARTLARTAGRPIVRLARTHSTVSVERAVLRLAGVAGADPDGIPWVNRLVDEVREQAGLEHGVALPVWDALRRSGESDLTRLAQRASSGGLDLRVPEGRDAERARRASTTAVRRGITAIDRRRAERERMVAKIGDAPQAAVDLPDRRHRRHPRGHPAGAGRGPRGRRRDRRHPLHRAVPAGLRAGGRHPRGVRRHLRHPGELPPDAGGTRRRLEGARPLRAADQLRVRALHAGDRDPGRARAAGHDAQRLDVRDPVPRHQPGPHLRRPALLPPGARPRGDHHQHRRGQLPHHRRRRRRGAHGHGEPAAQRVLRQGGGARGLAARARARLRDQPGRAGLVPAGARPRAARPRAVPEGAAEVDAAHQAHDR